MTEPREPRQWTKGDPEPADRPKVRDRHGDVWTGHPTGVWTSPETQSCSWEYIVRKFHPLTEVLPEPAPENEAACECCATFSNPGCERGQCVSGLEPTGCGHSYKRHSVVTSGRGAPISPPVSEDADTPTEDASGELRAIIEAVMRKGMAEPEVLCFVPPIAAYILAAGWRPPLPEGADSCGECKRSWDEIGDDVIVHFEGRPVTGRPLSVKTGWEGDQFVELPRDFAVPSPLPADETEPELTADPQQVLAGFAETLATITAVEHERALTEEVERRDEAEEWADKLAAALAPPNIVGEHSLKNHPWRNALEWAQQQAPADETEWEWGYRYPEQDPEDTWLCHEETARAYVAKTSNAILVQRRPAGSWVEVKQS